jgi:hypothetical protein
MSLNTITLTLTEEEQLLIESLARESGTASPAEAIHVLLRDVVAIYDALWDKKFAETQDTLNKLADDALVAYLAGETEDFDPDDDPEAL